LLACPGSRKCLGLQSPRGPLSHRP
jgi:hypothetical protein